jgi:hypothetical protein
MLFFNIVNIQDGARGKAKVDNASWSTPTAEIPSGQSVNL